MTPDRDLATLARKVLFGEATTEDDGITWSIETLDNGQARVMLWEDAECGYGCSMGEAWAGDRLVTCGKCHGYGRPFLGYALFHVQTGITSAEMPKECR